MSPRDPRAVAVAATSALALLVAALLTQHLRHGWPFSLHHGIAVTAANAPASPSHATGDAGSHPRAALSVDAARADLIGVRVEPARLEALSQPLRAVATVVPDEARVSHVHTRVSGWIEQLHVATTGSRVRAGQPLAGIFSQELLSTQNEYLAARRAASVGPRSAVVEGARARLRVFGMTDREIRGIEAADKARRLVTVSAPRAGVVLHRGISVGTAVDPSTELVTIADLSRVWVLAEVPEADIPGIREGTAATLEFPASGRAPIEAQVVFLSPTLTERTRTLRVRFVVPNPDGALRPGIYGTATFRVTPRSALTVPRDAIVDTGNSQHVFVASEGHYVPRVVKLGTRFGDRIEVREGLREGEAVVSSGVFLLDSESRLRASGGGTGHQHGSMAAASASVPPTSASAPPVAHPTTPPALPPKPATPPAPPAPPAPPVHQGHQGH